MATLSRRARNDETRRETEQALLAATVALLGEGTPYAEIGIEQLVRRAGFSRPTFYAYFRDKRELVLRLGEALERDVAAVTGPWLERGEGEVRPTLAAVLDAFRAHAATVSALVEAATYDPEVGAFWRGFHQRFLDAASARIRRADPGLASTHADARAFALVWMTERALTEHVAQPAVDEAALLDELAAFWDRA